MLPVTAIRSRLFLCLLALAFPASVVASLVEAPALALPALSAEEAAQGYRAGRVLTKVREQVLLDPRRSRTRDTSEEQMGIRVRRGFRHLRGQEILEFDRDRPVKDVIRELEATGLYEFVEPDRALHPLATPNDPAFGGSTGWNLRIIDAPAAWDVRRDAPDVIVAIIDSGARLTHEDLQANLWVNPTPSGSISDIHGINTLVTSGSGRGNPEDDSGHGSHVAGIIGAVGNNGRGTSGVAWRVKLMPLKFLPAEGSGSTSNAIICIDYAIEKRAHIINASYGSDSFSNSELEAIRRAGSAGIIFVAAAGNDGADVDTTSHYPSAFALANVVGVAATTRTDTLAGFSNYGSGSVELGAPGESIHSTVHSSNSAYGAKSGTSMAAPHVAGALALMRAQFPADSPRQLINRLLRAVDPAPALAGRTQTGGRLNLHRALTTTDSRPFNDNFGTRARLSGANVRARAVNAGGSREADEPNHANLGGGASLWWQWTATTTGPVFIDTLGSEYDTLLAVYTGTSVDSLTPLTSNDNSPTGGTTSRLSLNVTNGQTYQIAVDGKNGATGFTVLRIGSVPTHDNFASATTVTGSSFRVDSTNRNATREPDERNHAGVSGGRSVWYRWVAPADGTYQLAAFSTEIDTVAAVYTGNTHPLTVVGANDDMHDRSNTPYRNTDSLVTFSAASGATYYFVVDDSGSATGEGGNFNLTLNPSLWQAGTGDEINGTPAVGSDGTVYIGSTDGFLYAFNPSGSYRWRYASGEIGDSGAAVGADGTIYVGSTDGYLHAVTNSGTRRWRREVGNTAYGSTPALAEDGTIYFRSDDRLHAFSPDGVSRWTKPLSGDTYSSPVVGSDGTVYIGTTGQFHAFTPGGASKWTFNTNGDVFSSPAIAADGTLYFATLSSATQTGRLYALTSSGAQQWSISVGAGREISSSPVLGPDGTLYFASYDSRLYAVTSDGAVRWSYQMGDETRASSPAVSSDGTVYIGSYDGSVHVVSAADGARLSTLPTAGRIRSSMTLANGRLYFASADAKVYAFAAAAPADSPWPQFQRVATHAGRAGGQATPNEEPPPPPPSGGGGDADARVINLSTLTRVGGGEAALVGGFAIRGGSRQLLIRGVGPTLIQFGVPTPLSDPTLRVESSDGSQLFAQNDNWGGTASLAAAAAATGAFALPASSKDAALLVTLSDGNYVATVASADGATGPGMVEIYEVPGSGTGRFINLATRTAITSSQTATAGFVIRDGRKEVLLRVVGPTLGNYGVASPASDPRMTLYRGESAIASNDNWSSGAAHPSAFVLPAGSKDAALRLALDPGNYTMVAESVTPSGGIVLLEVYVIEP